MAHIHVIHENDEWTAPLLEELAALGYPFRDWHLARGELDVGSAPPAGVFYSRMSASSHTRGHRHAPEYTACVLAWLEAGGACVLNGSRALALEVSKVAQYAALRAHGIRVPRTIAAVGVEETLRAASRFSGPFLTKHNRAGKGLGVALFRGVDELERHIASAAFEPSVDGVTLIQEYIEAPTPHITRVEFIGRELLYAVRVDTSEGFELCPADVCAVDGAACPASSLAGEKFSVIDDFDHRLIDAYRSFMHVHAIDVAAFEFIVDAQGRDYTYDINTNTNYNAAAEARAGVSGMNTLARYLGWELEQHERGLASAPCAAVG